MLPAADADEGRSRLVVLTSSSAFPQYKAAWLALEHDPSAANFFQSYAWSGHVASVLERVAADRYQPLVAIYLVDGVVSAIWPLARQKKSGLWTLTPLDDPFGQFSNVLATDATTAKAAVHATITHIRTNRLADVMRLDRVFAGSHLETELLALGASRRGDVGAPVVPLAPWPSMAALKSSRNKKTMKNLRNATNRLAHAGPHAHAVAVGDARVDAIISATYVRRSAWLSARGMTAPQFRSPAHHDVLQGGDAWGIGASRVGFELLSCGKPIAHQWGFLHDGRYYAYMSATDPAVVHLSPGRLHLAFVIESAMGLGVDAIEFMTPASDYKMVWTDTARQLVNYGMALSVKGRVFDAVWHRGLRPIAKAAFYRMPAVLRRRAVSSDEAHDAGGH